jgi:hypothetical protein
VAAAFVAIPSDKRTPLCLSQTLSFLPLLVILVPPAGVDFSTVFWLKWGMVGGKRCLLFLCPPQIVPAMGLKVLTPCVKSSAA